MKPKPKVRSSGEGRSSTAGCKAKGRGSVVGNVGQSPRIGCKGEFLSSQEGCYVRNLRVPRHQGFNSYPLATDRISVPTTIPSFGLNTQQEPVEPFVAHGQELVADR